jgi:5-deoxy-glucuronate isomerase
MSAAAPVLDPRTCVLRATHKPKGRTRPLTPETAPLRHLHYGRILLDAGAAPLEFATGGHETGLICLGGGAAVEVDDAHCFALARYDSLYVPRGSRVRLKPSEAGCDLAEISAPVAGDYPIQFVPFSAVTADPMLHFRAGGESSARDLNILIGKNVVAGRILAGVTFSDPGNWTSWPPHEHGATLEEAYLYIDMPKPAWGIQLVYTDPQSPELMVAVREGDVVVMPEGYHPNVAAPGGRIGFLWMMAARREVEDREFGLVNVQREYAAGGTGLEASRGESK